MREDSGNMSGRSLQRQAAPASPEPQKSLGKEFLLPSLVLPPRRRGLFPEILPESPTDCCVPQLPEILICVVEILVPPPSWNYLLKQTIGRFCEYRYEHLATVIWSLTCDTCKTLGEVFSSLSVLYSAGNFSRPGLMEVKLPVMGGAVKSLKPNVSDGEHGRGLFKTLS